MSRPAGLSEQLRARLEELATRGLDGLPAPEGLSSLGRGRAKKGPEKGGRVKEAAGAPAGPARVARDSSVAAAPGAPRPGGEGAALPLERRGGASGNETWRELDLPALAGHLADCQACKLSRGRTQVVFGTGDPKARLMFVGEGPGREEDLQGEPFVGKAGRLLTDMIEKGMGLQRSAVYIANVVKCRPPENRDPEPDEIEACEGFLARQVELVAPEVIVALGRVAVQALLRSRQPIGRLRGNWQVYRGIPLMPTFHPAYLLRSPREKRAAWEDLKQVLAKLELPRT